MTMTTILRIFVMAITITMFAVIALSTSSVYAQAPQQLPSQAAPQAQQHFTPPSQAQTQADIAAFQNSPEGKQIQHIKGVLESELNRAGPAHAADVLANLTAHGLISCPMPIDVQHPNCVIHPHSIQQGMPIPPLAANPPFSTPIPPPK